MLDKQPQPAGYKGVICSVITRLRTKFMPFLVSLEENRNGVLPHLSYSLYLTDNKLLLYYAIKKAGNGRRFDSRHDVKNIVFQYINSILK